MTQEDAIATMIGAGAQPLEPYRDGGTPWRCKCLRCGAEVTPRLWLVRQGVGVCPLCTVYGFDRVGPAIVYVVTHPELHAHKVGVAGVSSRRLDEHRAKGWRLYRAVEVASGAEALAIESAVIRWMRKDRGWPTALSEGSGHTETVAATLVSTRTIWKHVLHEIKRFQIDTRGT
jgi:hypothetical protein